MFLQAKPIYAKGKSMELNSFVSFRAELPSLVGAEILVTAATFYRLTVNGEFVMFGPARTAEKYARVDRIDLSSYHKSEKNEIVIEVAGYACRSLSTVCQASFLCAEILIDGKVAAYTGRDFTTHLTKTRLQKVHRYAAQRHFSEAWDFRGASVTPCADNATETEVLPLTLTYLDRTAPYPRCEDIFLGIGAVTSRGTLRYNPPEKMREKPFSFQPSERWGRYTDPVGNPYLWIQEQEQTKTAGEAHLPVTLSENEYAILDFSRIETGFLQFSALADRETDLVIGFSEDAAPDHFEYTDMSAFNAIEYFLPAGKEINAMTFEPYVFRWIFIGVKKGELTVNRFGVKTFENDVSKLEIPALPSPTLTKIYRAAMRTFAHNAVDVFSDCPSRERAGWLCDSFFTAKTEYELFGKVPVEDAFLENYRLYEDNGDLPEGMIPMCFPADVQDEGKFIPQWSMWFIIELEEYLNQRNPSVDRELFRPRVEALLAFYAKHENADGLLEKLPSWNFVEWSVANQWTQDVNYPTNFLYAQVLESAYRIYGDESLLSKAAAVRKTTITQSFNGSVFLDHAVRNEQGELCLLDDCSEAGQYYAILFGGFDLNDAKYAQLKHLVTKVFTPTRTEYPEIHRVNAFIGAYLRLATLIKIEEYETLLSDVVGFFGHMGDSTETLWEYRERHGSRDHGFASYALVAIRRALNLP